MDIHYFKREVAHRLEKYKIKYSSFKDGDFGDLERVEIEGFNKLATVDLWSKGWINIDIYDCTLDAQVMNFLLKPDEIKKKGEVMDTFVKALLADE